MPQPPAALLGHYPLTAHTVRSHWARSKHVPAQRLPVLTTLTHAQYLIFVGLGQQKVT